MGLTEYKRKRDFEVTPEPTGRAARKGSRERSFVIHKHAARRLHYDLRLENDGVLMSWAVPKGPSYDTHDKRLAVHVEDHPLDYGGFEGVIPRGEYGAGEVIVWDRGTWEPFEEGDVSKQVRDGHLKMVLHGEKLQGRWVLIRTARQQGDKEQWLLIKERDEHVRPEYSVVDDRPESVASGATIEDIAERGQPPSPEAVSSFSERVSALKGARKRALPKTMSPELATLVTSAPEGDGWLHEIKFDGYRVLARIDGDDVRLFTRGGHDWTEKMLPLAEALRALPVRDAWLDGEIAVLAENGVTDFGSLVMALGTKGFPGVAYFVFDLMHLDGHDLTKVPLVERKQLLADIVAGAGESTRLRYSDHIVGDGEAFHRQACKLELEGMVSKKADAAYVQSRTKSWLKTKCRKRQEFVIVGYTLQDKPGEQLAAVLLGANEDGRLVYVGRAGSGFTDKTSRQVLERLKALERETTPLQGASPDPGGRHPRGRGRPMPVHWVEPELVAEIDFAEMTAVHQLRQASFKGLREDKTAAEVTVEQAEQTEAAGEKAERTAAAPGAVVEIPEPSAKPKRKGKHGDDIRIRGVRVTNPGKVYYADTGFTKEQVVRYYDSVADVMLYELRMRPLMMVRCPEGIREPPVAGGGRRVGCFYQKHVDEDYPRSIHRVNIAEKGKTDVYGHVETPEGVVALAQLGSLEIHTWGSRVDKLEFPDRIVLDMDPGPDVDWDTTVEAAFTARKILRDLGLESWVKTTGGKGLHVTVPLTRRHEWPEVREFAEAVVVSIVAEEPERYVKVMTKAKRQGKVFIDYLRNGRGATFIAPYSTRSRPGATVATPVSWHELDRGVDPGGFDILTVPKRVARMRVDPWEDVNRARQSITKDAWAALGGRPGKHSGKGR